MALEGRLGLIIDSTARTGRGRNSRRRIIPANSENLARTPSVGSSQPGTKRPNTSKKQEHRLAHSLTNNTPLWLDRKYQNIWYDNRELY